MDAAQEIRGDHELRLARFYLDSREAPTAAEMRSQYIVEQLPRFTKMDEALWCLARAEEAQENTQSAIKHYTRIVQDYPNSVFWYLAEERVRYFDSPVPESDPSINIGLAERAERIAQVRANLVGNSSTITRRAILLNEWNQVDSDLILEIEQLTSNNAQK
jgi:outer membrane protein assembly factor BamD (BamD/ComL family)